MKNTTSKFNTFKMLKIFIRARGDRHLNSERPTTLPVEVFWQHPSHLCIVFQVTPLKQSMSSSLYHLQLRNLYVSKLQFVIISITCKCVHFCAKAVIN